MNFNTPEETVLKHDQFLVRPVHFLALKQTLTSKQAMLILQKTTIMQKENGCQF